MALCSAKIGGGRGDTTAPKPYIESWQQYYILLEGKLQVLYVIVIARALRPSGFTELPCQYLLRGMRKAQFVVHV